MTLHRRLPALLLSIAVLALPAVAQAGTVSVERSVTEDGQNLSTLRFVAAPGEANAVTVTIATAADPGKPATLRIVDASAPLIVGSGCTGGGSAGAAALCEVAAPRAPDQLPCGKMCLNWVKGTGYSVLFRPELGDEADSFDGSAFDHDETRAYWMEVVAGAGDDQVTTGAAYDEVEGGSGNDLISTGEGDDTVNPGLGDDSIHLANGGGHVIAEPVPDGSDLIDLGAEGWADYSTRTAPLTMHGDQIGAAGEVDTIIGTATVETGSGDDVLESEKRWLIGGPGNDVLVGDSQDTQLDGDEGNDRLLAATISSKAASGATCSMVVPATTRSKNPRTPIRRTAPRTSATETSPAAARATTRSPSDRATTRQPAAPATTGSTGERARTRSVAAAAPTWSAAKRAPTGCSAARARTSSAPGGSRRGPGRARTCRRTSGSTWSIAERARTPPRSTSGIGG